MQRLGNKAYKKGVIFLQGRIKKSFAGLISGLIISLSSSGLVGADEAYDVYNYDRWGEAIPSQAGYLARFSVSGSDLGTDDFSSPKDIFIDRSGLFYIVDSGNNRIVITDKGLREVKNIIDNFTYRGEKLTLKNPQGIFVSDEGDIYIADTENSRVIRTDINGNADLIIEKPVSELYPENLTFLPQKVIADKAGYVYVVVNNITSGSVMYNKDGEFVGFYGANRVEKTGKVIWKYFWKRLSPDNMKKYMKDSVPAPITSFDIDKDGFVYTCSNSLTQELDAIKKVNAAGYNLFADFEVHFGDAPTADYSEYPENSYVDIDVNGDGLISCLDYSTGRIFQYDEDCNLLFIIGSSGNQLGTFRQVSAVESDDKCIYVADSQKNTITVFEETVFGSIVHQATRLYNDGYYEEALEPWFEVLKRDGNYRRAYIGIASAMINNGNYSEAMKYAKLADSQWQYDRAFEGWRTEFINKYFGIISLVLIITAAIVFLLVRKIKKAKGGCRK